MLRKFEPKKGKRILFFFNCILIGLLLNNVFFSYAGQFIIKDGLFKYRTGNFVMLLALFSIEAIIFTGTIIYLCNVMKRIKNVEAFSREKKSIFVQFFIFNIAFLSRSIFFAI